MKCTLDHTRTVFIHDHDGVHYRYGDNPDYINFLGQVKAQAVNGLLPELDVETAYRLNQEFYYACGDGSRGFYDMAVQKGHSIEEFRLKLHHEYHRVAFQRMKEEWPDWVKPCPETQQFMQRLSGHVRHIILSQGCPENFIKPNLETMGLLHHFEHVLGYAEFNFEQKAESAFGIGMAMDMMKANPRNCVFIEDTIKNIAKAKERYPDLCTVYICDNKPLDVVPDCVDIQVDTFRRLKQAVTRVHFPEAMFPALEMAA